MSKSKIEKLLNLIQESDSYELETSNEDMANLQVKMNVLLSEAKKLEKQSWKQTAKLEREAFGSIVKNQISSLLDSYGGREGLLKAISNGVLGVEAQLKYQTQFRNKNINQLTDEEIKSILGDHKILELLKSKK